MATDLSNLTEELFIRSFTRQVGLRMPIFAMLLGHHRVNAQGGTKITYPVVKDDAVDEAQSYYVIEGLTVAQTQFTELAKFSWKYVQMPMKYAVDVEIENHLATSEVKRFDVVKLIVERGQDGIRRKLDKLFHTTSSSDSGRDFQSVYDALDHSRTYGEITSNTTTVAYWNGASLGDSYTDRATATALSMDNLRKIKYICLRYAPENAKLYCFLPEALFSKAAGLCEAAKIYTSSNESNSKLMKYGHESFQAYNIEFVMDSYMTLNSQTAYMVVMNPETWELRLHPSRAFKVTPFVWQAQQANGLDEMVSRILVCGNLCCKKPRANMWKSNVS